MVDLTLFAPILPALRLEEPTGIFYMISKT
jgi:hypothetical protein